MELSREFPIQLLCEKMGIPRSSFYNWKKSVESPSEQKKRLAQSIELFQQYHTRFPSHGYRWLNAKIRLDKGIVFSDPYAHKCCKIAGIKSVSKHYKYKKPGDSFKTYPNLLLAGINIAGPMECVVSDMTAFYVKGIYYELTLYMDLWNDELIAHSLSSKRGDRMTYLNGLRDIIEFKKQYPNQELVLHSDRGSVYASKSYNELLPMYNITRSMSRAGTPTDNAAMEAINGWVKAELFTDLHITSADDVPGQVTEYIRFFNEERPAYALGYLTPKQYRERFTPKQEKADP
mgnify:FL=1